MSSATVELLGTEIFCKAGAAEARFAVTDAAAKLKAWAARYDSASWRDDEGELVAIGQELFAWLDSTSGWATAWVEAPGDRELEIRVRGRDGEPENALLDAPWELLLGPRGPLAADAAHLFVVARRIGAPAAPPAPAFGDLSLMFMAASPGGAADLDYEGEEMAILEATARLGLHVAVEETGALDFLGERLVSDEGPFEILHLSCHGAIDPETGPALALEDAFGELDLAGPSRIMDRLGTTPPSLLFLSACRTAEYGRPAAGGPLPGYRDQAPRRDAASVPAPATPLARQMAERVANVVGWDGSVFDVDATEFAKHFYRELAGASSVPRAAAMARKALFELKATSQRGRHWHLARVYLGAPGGGGLCDKKKPKRKKVAAPERVFLDKKGERVPVASRAEFVGRRREIQALLRAYRGGEAFGALIHGMGALGKSSLAARILSRMPTLTPVVVFERYDALALFDAVLGALPPQLRQAETAAWREQVRADPDCLAEALEAWLDGPLAAKPILLVIDDLERILETPRPSEDKTAVAQDYRAALAAVLAAFARVDSGSRLVFTSRYDFQLLNGHGHDLAAPLARVPLRPMNASEQEKQWRAAGRVAGRETASLGEEAKALQTRALAASQGNPWLQAILSRPILSGQFEVAIRAIAQIEEFLRVGVPPTATLIGQSQSADGDIIAFFDRLCIDTYYGALTEEQCLQMNAAALFAPSVPIPAVALAAAGSAIGVENANGAIARMIALGLFDDYGNIANTHYVAINPLARPLACQLALEEKQTAARFVLTSLGKDKYTYISREFHGEMSRLAFIVVMPDYVESEFFATYGKSNINQYQTSSYGGLLNIRKAE